MNVKSDLKDWQIAKEMFGKNTKNECNIVKTIRKKEISKIEELCEGWSMIYTENHVISNEVGWVIENCLLDL